MISSTKASGKTVNAMARASRFGLTGRFSRDIERTTPQMVKEDLSTQMVMSIWVNGWIITRRERESSLPRIRRIRGIGWGIRSMGRERITGMMGLCIKEVMRKAFDTVKVNSSSRTNPSTRENSLKTKSTEREPTTGQTADTTKETGKTEQWMAKESSHGKMARTMWEAMSTTIKRDLGLLLGPMEGSTVGSG
jgi:hypothetical protein